MEAPPEKIFAVVADPETHPIWRPSATEFRAETDEPLRVGSRLVEEVRFLGRRYRSRYEVSELEPGRAFAVRTLEGPVGLELRCALERLDGERTRVTFAMESGVSLPLRLVLGWYLQDEARRLKELVESLP